MVGPFQLLRHIQRAPEVALASRQTSAFWQLLARYLEIRTGPYPFNVPLQRGGALTLHSAGEVKVFWHVFVRSSYVLPERCTTILDVGANIGIFSVWAASHKPGARIIALEPFPETFTALETNIRQNGLENRVQCEPVGLAGESGERQMRTVGESPNRQLVLDREITDEACTVAVSCISLSECLDRFGLDTLDLMKMDIEGSEWAVLMSTPPEVLARIRYIELEYHEVNPRFGYTPEKLFDHLASAGHRLTFRTEDRHHTGLARFNRSI